VAGQFAGREARQLQPPHYGTAFGVSAAVKKGPTKVEQLTAANLELQDNLDKALGEVNRLRPMAEAAESSEDDDPVYAWRFDPEKAARRMKGASTTQARALARSILSRGEAFRYAFDGSVPELAREIVKFDSARTRLLLDSLALLEQGLTAIEGNEGEAELFRQGSRKDAAHGVTVPVGHARHLIDRGALGLTKHRDHHVLLRGALRIGSRLRIWQSFDGRPQLIDQCIAVTNFSPLIDAGQRVPQCQEPLAVEWGGVQFLVGRDDNLAIADLGRRLAAQCDAVIADDEGAHEWVLLIGPAARRRR